MPDLMHYKEDLVKSFHTKLSQHVTEDNLVDTIGALLVELNENISIAEEDKEPLAIICLEAAEDMSNEHLTDRENVIKQFEENQT